MIREAWAARELLYFFAWRDIKIRYKQTLLGASWAILQPLIGMIVFTAVFVGVGGFETAGAPGPLFYGAALVPWTFFAGALTNAGNSLVTNSDLLTKVYFPRALLPAATVVAGLVDVAIATLLLAGLYAWYGVTPDAELLLWPVMLGALALLALGAGLFVSALNVMYRDVKYALPFAVQLLLYISPVIYAVESVPDAWQPVLQVNPLTGILSGCRAAAIPGMPVDLPAFGVSLGITAVVALLGARYFRAVERRFADVV